MDIIHIPTIEQTLLVALAVNIVAVLYMVMFVGCDTLSFFRNILALLPIMVILFLLPRAV